MFFSDNSLNPNIRITGPTPLPPQVREAVSRQIFSHRSQDFNDILERVTDGIRSLVETKQMPMIFTASGTGGLEAAIVNALSPHDCVVAIKVGYFGQRFVDIAKHFKLRLIELDIPWGNPIELELLRKALRSINKVDAVLITHNESSTGVLNPLEAITKVIQEETKALILVDAITSMGVVPIKFDEWGIDVLVTASQKALMAPPGLAIVVASEKVLLNSNRKKLPHYYFNFTDMQNSMEKGSTTYTPAILSVFGLDASLKLITEEGISNTYMRHAKLAHLLREGIKKTPLKIFATEGFESPAITACLVPKNFSANTLRDRLIGMNVFISLGHGEWKERMIRIGHMGYVNEDNIYNLIESLNEIL